MSLIVSFERCPLPNTSCSQCQLPLDPSLLSIKKQFVGGSKYYHLPCYEPAEAQTIDLYRHIRLKKWVKEDLKVARQWAEQWNRRFQVSEETLPVQFKSRAVVTRSSPMRRLLLETFQYLSLREIEQLAAFVCKEWFHTTRENEFWKTRYLAQFDPAKTSEEDNYRSKFIVQTHNCCWICRKFLTLQEIKLICPVRKLPVCQNCSSSDAGCIVTINSYFNHHKITPTLRTRLGFHHFIYNKYRQNYVSDLGNTILPYAERRKKALLEALQPHCPAEISVECLQALTNYDLKGYYKKRFPNCTGILWALGEFCGLDEARESFEANVADFLSIVKQLESSPLCYT